MLNLQSLDDRVRRYMLEEIEADTAAGSLYVSPRLSPTGRERYVELLKVAAVSGDDASLAAGLRSGGCIAETEMSHRNGKPYSKRVPENAHETLAEGEFNRFYLRGLCRAAMEDGVTVEAYRARASANPRAESEAIVGREFAPEQLLTDLRLHTGVDTALGLPPGPNSGLSARIKIRPA